MEGGVAYGCFGVGFADDVRGSMKWMVSVVYANILSECRIRGWHRSDLVFGGA